jgi:intracellular multiplication protein IcmP
MIMPPPQQQQGSDENAALWMSVLAIVTLVIIWFTLHEWIAYFFLKLKLLEINFLSIFTHQFQPLAAQLQALTPEDAKNIQINQLSKIGMAVGNVLRYPLIVLLVLAAGLLYFGNVSARYRSTYTMQRLAMEEKMDWPQIQPVLSLNLIDTPLDQGPWSMALNPMMYAKAHNLLLVEKETPTEHQLTSAIKVKVTVKRLEAKQTFLMQLGNYWHNLTTLPLHTRALFAMFAAKAHGDKDSVTKLNNQIAVSAAQSQYKQINYEGLDALLAKHTNEKDVQKVVARHAFVYTVMASMLEFARLDGVHASADFLWLKPIDRRLWYTLNCVGRKTPYVEIAGIFAHRNAELVYNKPLYVPMVDEAVDALEIAINEILFKPNEEA